MQSVICYTIYFHYVCQRRAVRLYGYIEGRL